MHIQYFRDAELIVSEILRALKRGGVAILVVQDSWYKNIHIPLSTIYSEMAVRLGASSAKSS